MNDLIEFLKSLVMTTIVVDKKYRETIPEIMSNMKTLVESSEDGESKPKKKKPKKMRIGKNGLYPTEEGHIKKWWNTHNPETGDDESTPNPNETRYHVSYLRTRETQLQMIIIFEILALEALKSPENATESQLPGLETSTPPKELPKKRSKHNLPVLMDLHADRLCIWRSTTLDEVRAIAESQMPETQKSDKHSDPLKDFCVDIILPL